MAVLNVTRTTTALIVLVKICFIEKSRFYSANVNIKNISFVHKKIKRKGKKIYICKPIHGNILKKKYYEQNSE